MARLLCKFILRNFADYSNLTIVEPFAGGAGASLALLDAGIVDHVIINDYDKSIYAFWQTAVNNSDYLIDKIKSTRISIAEWHRQRACYLKKDSSLEELAYATFFLNRTNRSGIIQGRPIGGLKQRGIWNLKSRFDKKKMIERFKHIKGFSQKISVSNLDALELLKSYNDGKSHNEILLFLDPPYYKHGTELYLNSFTDDDHKILANHLLSSNMRWIMTYDDHAFVRSLYVRTKKRHYKLGHCAHRPKIGDELILVSPNLIMVPLRPYNDF